MEENKDLYYEAVVKYSDDVKHVYNTAVEKNVKYYRGVSESGKFFGWQNGEHVHAAEGQEWFENPEYIEPEPQKAVDDAVEVTESPALESIEDVREEPIPNEETAFDFEARIAELEKALEEETTQSRERKDKLDELENAIKVIVDFIKGA